MFNNVDGGNAAERIGSKFPLDCRLERDRHGGFPDEFHREVADGGWLVMAPSSFGS